MRRFSKKRNRRQLRADQLQAALENQAATHPSTDSLVEVARMLAPAEPVSDESLARVEERALRAFHAARIVTRPDAGSRDEQGEDGYEVHTAKVDLPDGRIYMADVERIDQERAAKAAREAVELAEEQSDQ